MVKTRIMRLESTQKQIPYKKNGKRYVKVKYMGKDGKFHTVERRLIWNKKGQYGYNFNTRFIIFQ